MTVRFVDDRRGATLIEFALLSPVMLMLLMGLFDLSHRAYVQSVLIGEMQTAARKNTLERNATAAAATAIDQAVVQRVRRVAPNLTWKSSRKHYRRFNSAAPEDFTDTNGNNRYDPGECYADINGNKQWDADPGIDGQGGANDVTLYTMQITYPRLFPLAGLMGWPSRQVVSATTSLKNQPYGTQGQSTPETICK